MWMAATMPEKMTRTAGLSRRNFMKTYGVEAEQSADPAVPISPVPTGQEMAMTRSNFRQSILASRQRGAPAAQGVAS
jgi:hypothetical protein